MTKIKRKDRGLFEYQERMEKLNNIKTPMDKLNLAIPWEIFRPILNEALEPKEQKAPGGASHYDYVFMFKILVVQKYYNLSDEQTEFRINDSLSLQRFLGISLSDKVPDHNKIWDFRERLIKANAVKKLFKLFDQTLENQGIVGKSGVIVDASFVDVPRQRNHREENKQIKDGKIPEDWKDNPDKLSHKDTDARWAMKNKELHFGYKNHAKVDVKSKIVREYAVTDASVHDSQVVEPLLNEEDKGKPFYADSAYIGQMVSGILEKFGMKNRIHEKGFRNKSLTEKQKTKNKRKSRIRVRVEHVFGFIENSMNGSTIKSIGKERASGQIGLMNLVHNFARYTMVKGRIASCAA
jgi:transposase, IS5 family